MSIGLSDVRSWWVDLLRSMRDHFISMFFNNLAVAAFAASPREHMQ